MKFDYKKYIRRQLLTLTPYQSAREEFEGDGRSMILLDANENPFSSEVNRYPDPMQKKLKKEIAKWKWVGEDQLYLSNGSDEFISNVIMSCCEPGEDSIMIVPPTFGMYKVSAKTFGVDVQEVPLTDAFQLDVDSILKTADQRSKVIFIPTPNNPTANNFDLNSIEQIIRGFPGLVVVDEAYVEFCGNPSVISWLSNYNNLMVCQTFSKAQGMAGARLGMAFAHSDFISFFNRIKSPYNINSLTINAVLKRLKEQDKVEEQVKLVLKERRRLENAFSSIPFIEECYPSDANFLLVRLDDSSHRHQQLLENGIVVRNPSKNLNCENTLRISVGLPEENNHLIEVLSNLS
ncbi:MAG: histidinol-phosphate transaminase [Flavobacteriaceae bacterium]|nr:histidinol-phosphate transaminase [Flavobacteriaceae bacterium]